MDEDAEMWWWWQDLEMREALNECEHGIHRDSGKWCPECTNRSEDEPE